MSACVEPGALSGISSRRVLETRVHVTDCRTAAEQILAWARAGRPGYVCAATVHMLMEAHDTPEFRRVLEEASLVTADGMPVAWALRLLGTPGAQRVCGPDLMQELCALAARTEVPIGLYGGAPEVLESLQRHLSLHNPGLRVAYAHSPPFRELSAEEDRQVVAEVAASGARLLFVGLGCPKQERWMAAHARTLAAVQIGVGAAFDFACGNKPRPPRFVQTAGLEWVFRLACEPRRLWRRYLYHNPRFLALLSSQLVRSR